MKQPESSLRADSDEEPPDFDALTPIDDLVAGERTRDDFLMRFSDSMSRRQQARSPTTRATALTPPASI